MSASRGANYGGPTVEGTCGNPAIHQSRSIPIRTTERCLGHRRVHLSRAPISRRAIRAATSSPTTPELDSPADVRRARQRERRFQLRARGRFARRSLRRHRVSHRGPRRRALLCRPRILRCRRHFRPQQDPPNPLHPSNIRRPRLLQREPAPGPVPLTVNFSSAGSPDPEGQPLTYLWTFGDGNTTHDRRPGAHLCKAGQYTARLDVRTASTDALAPSSY